MSVYVGIDVHCKRSHVAVVTEDGQVQLNKNVVNGSEPFLRLIGDLPAGTPVAFEAAFGWSWLADLLEDYGFDRHLVHPLRCKAIASARLKNDKVDAAILAQLRRGRSRVCTSPLMPITVRGRVAVATRTRSRRSGAERLRAAWLTAAYRSGHSALRRVTPVSRGAREAISWWCPDRFLALLLQLAYARGPRGCG